MPSNPTAIPAVPSPTEPPYDVAICWRIYPRVSGRPIFGFKDKLELVRVNAESFRAAIGGLRAKLWVLLDNCPLEYKNLIESVFQGVTLEIISLSGEGNE